MKSREKTFRKRSIKTRILALLVFVLLFCFAGYLGIFHYTSEQVGRIAQQSLQEISRYGNRAHLDLKDDILTRYIADDVQVYADYIDHRAATEKLSPRRGRTGEGAALGRLLQVIEVERHRAGYVMIIDGEGKVITVEGPPDNPVCAAHFFVGSRLLKSPESPAARAISTILHSQARSGVTRECCDGETYVFIFCRLESLNLYLVKAIPERYLNDQVQVFNRKFDAFTGSVQREFLSLSDEIHHMTLTLFVSMLIIIYVIGSLMSRSIIAPLIRLKEETRHIGRGDLARMITIRTGDEIEELADTFNLMVHDLNTYIDGLRESIAREKAIEGEIKLAARIQQSSLPKGTPGFGPETGVELCACLKPSKIVSGDFYDYFFVDPGHLFFALGDVSGKNISAALFMMTTKIVMKRFALMGQAPHTILKNVNDTLVLDNQTCMYSTIFCGILNTETGRLDYCNAGHTSPLIFDGSSWEYLRAEENMLVGLTSRAEFIPESRSLGRGAMVLLYSDGVTESRNPAGDLFSEERLREVPGRGGSPCAVIKEVDDAVAAFARDAEQYDDITMLCLGLTASPGPPAR